MIETEKYILENTNIFCDQCEVIMEETVNVQTVVQYWEAASRYQLARLSWESCIF